MLGGVAIPYDKAQDTRHGRDDAPSSQSSFWPEQFELQQHANGRGHDQKWNGHKKRPPCEKKFKVQVRSQKLIGVQAQLFGLGYHRKVGKHQQGCRRHRGDKG